MKISLITVSYNSEDTIADTIESVYAQDYRNIEYIIVDGESIDDTVGIVKHYETLFVGAGKQYFWVSEKDNGIYDALNKGINMATGDVIGIINSDDYFYDNSVLSDIVVQFENKDIDCLYGNMVYIEPKTKRVVRYWKSRSFKQGLFEKSWSPGHATFYCKKDIYNKFGLYRTDFKIASDVELMYRFIQKHRIKSQYLNRYMVVMRRGGISNRGLKSTIIVTKEMRKAFADHGHNLNLAKYLFYKALKIKEFWPVGGIQV